MQNQLVNTVFVVRCSGFQFDKGAQQLLASRLELPLLLIQGLFLTLQLIIRQLQILMKTINQQVLLQFVAQNSISIEFESYLKNFHVCAQMKLQKMTIQKMHLLCAKINTLESKEDSRASVAGKNSFFSWKKGEYKLFLWILVYYSFIHNIGLPQFNQNELSFLQTIFLRQDPTKLKYEIRYLNNPKKSSKCTWELDEMELFLRIVQKQLQASKKMEWKVVAYDLFALSQEKYFKTNAQCRQRWLNHLNPQINKKNWSREQDYMLMRSVQQHGTKWSEIARIFEGSRTEHMVKNRYLSLINKWGKGKTKKTVKQIENKILKALRRTFYKKTKSSFESEDDKQMQHSGYTDHSQNIISQLDYETTPVDSESDLREERIQMSKTVDTVQRTEFSSQFSKEQQKKSESIIPECLAVKIGPECYLDLSLKETIDDVVKKLGYECPQQVDMFFENDQIWEVDLDEY